MTYRPVTLMVLSLLTHGHLQVPAELRNTPMPDEPGSDSGGPGVQPTDLPHRPARSNNGGQAGDSGGSSVAGGIDSSLDVPGKGVAK